MTCFCNMDLAKILILVAELQSFFNIYSYNIKASNHLKNEYQYYQSVIINLCFILGRENYGKYCTCFISISKYNQQISFIFLCLKLPFILSF